MQDVKEGTVLTTEIQNLIRDEVTRQIGETRQALEQSIAEIRARTVDDFVTLVVFSGDLDKAMAAMVIATGAAAAGLETSLFFTFWGLSILKKKGAAKPKHGLKEKMFAMMTPASTKSLGISKMNYLGMGIAYNPGEGRGRQWSLVALGR